MDSLLDRPAELVGMMAAVVFLATFAYRGVEWLIDEATKGIDKKPPESAKEGRKYYLRWLGKMPSPDASRWLGFLERTLFFFAIWFDAWAVIAGWLAFKAVSKWDAWSNITKIPNTSHFGELKDLEHLDWRRRWASWVYMRSAGGKLGNLFAAGIAVVIARAVSGILF